MMTSNSGDDIFVSLHSREDRLGLCTEGTQLYTKGQCAKAVRFAIAPCADMMRKKERTMPNNDDQTPADTLMNAPGASAITPARVSDIAVEITRLCGAVRASAHLLAFIDEPGDFRALLDRKSS
jgi:hypothetical protein